MPIAAAKSWALSGGATKERDLSWLDYSYPADLSADGKTLLFDEEGIGGGVQYGDVQDLTYAVYIRNTDGTPAIRLGEGGANCPLAGSEVGHHRHANFARSNSACCRPARVKLSRSPTIRSTISGSDGFPTASVSSFPATNQGAGCGSTYRIFPEENPRRFRPKASTPRTLPFLPTAKSWSASAPIKKATYFPRRAATPRVVKGMEAGDLPINWSQDGRSIYLYRTGEVPAKVYRLELATGKKTVWKEIAPLDPTGVSTIGPILMTPGWEDLRLRLPSHPRRPLSGRGPQVISSRFSAS